VPEAKVSYRAAGAIREFRVQVCQYPDNTVIMATWVTREKGDLPLQGHAWVFKHEGKGRVKSLQHAVNLALWALRKVGGPDWVERR